MSGRPASPAVAADRGRVAVVARRWPCWLTAAPPRRRLASGSGVRLGRRPGAGTPAAAPRAALRRRRATRLDQRRRGLRLGRRLPGGSLSAINPGSKRPIAVETAGFPTDVSAGEDAAWLALADRGAVQRVSGTEGAAEPVEVAGFPFRVAAGEGSVWAMSQTSSSGSTPTRGEAGAAVELGGDLASIAAGEGAVWVVRRGDEVVKLDPESGERSASAEVPGAFSVAVGESAAGRSARSSGGSERHPDAHRSRRDPCRQAIPVAVGPWTSRRASGSSGCSSAGGS